MLHSNCSGCSDISEELKTASKTCGVVDGMNTSTRHFSTFFLAVAFLSYAPVIESRYALAVR